MASAAGREGIRRSEKAKMPEEALLTGGSEAERPVNVRAHTYTQSQTPNAQLRGLWLAYPLGVEVTELSTNKQHTLSLRNDQTVHSGLGSLPLVAHVLHYPSPHANSLVIGTAVINTHTHFHPNPDCEIGKICFHNDSLRQGLGRWHSWWACRTDWGVTGIGGSLRYKTDVSGTKSNLWY